MTAGDATPESRAVAPKPPGPTRHSPSMWRIVRVPAAQKVRPAIGDSGERPERWPQQWSAWYRWDALGDIDVEDGATLNVNGFTNAHDVTIRDDASLILGAAASDCAELELGANSLADVLVDLDAGSIASSTLAGHARPAGDRGGGRPAAAPALKDVPARPARNDNPRAVPRGRPVLCTGWGRSPAVENAPAGR